jgi:MFS transporter, MCT family, aspergillic acid transporter
MLEPPLTKNSLFRRAFAGILADKVGRYNVFVVVCYTTSILILALWIPATNNAATIVFAGFFGFTSGAYVSLLPALVAQISPPREIGFRTGLLFLFCSLGGLTTSPIAGAILARENGDYLGMKIFAGVMVLIGTTGVLFAKLAQSGWKLMARF